MNPRRRRALLALGWLVTAVAAPAAVRVVGRTDLGAREVLAVETAGRGQRLLDLAGSDRGRLSVYRRVLGRGDHAYVAGYGTGVLLGVSLLDGVARVLGTVVSVSALAADVVENEALERALGTLLVEPGRPQLADGDAALARTAAAAKFGLLVPAVAMSVAGVVRGLRGERSKRGR